MGKPISQVKPYNDEAKWEDEVQWLDFPDNKLVLIRLHGTVTVLARHWIKTLSGKIFPQWCPKFDSVSEEFLSKRVCPDHDDFDDKAQKMLVGNCIVRSLQDRGEDNPVRGFMLPHAVNDDIMSIYQLLGNIDPG